MTETAVAPTQNQPVVNEGSRWIALYVLCVGMLMIVLDATIVNVALPVDPGRPGLLPVEPRLGRQRLPDQLRRPAAALGTARRPARPAQRLPRRAGRLHHRLADLRPVAEPGHADRGALRAGRRRRARLGRDPRDDRDDVPRAAGAGQGDRRLQLRRLRGRLDRPAARRLFDPGHQLALDLLREHPDRDRHGRAGLAAGRASDQRHRPPRRRRRRRGRARHERADARRLHDREGRRLRLGLGRTRSASARSRWRCWPASWRARRRPERR